MENRLGCAVSLDTSYTNRGYPDLFFNDKYPTGSRDINLIIVLHPRHQGVLTSLACGPRGDGRAEEIPE